MTMFYHVEIGQCFSFEEQMDKAYILCYDDIQGSFLVNLKTGSMSKVDNIFRPVVVWRNAKVILKQ